MRKRKKAESYFELLRDPRWQKSRLETMQRAGFACERCGDKETTLNVHHKNYKRDHAPWEYELNNFVCLCRVCHEFVHNQKETINNLLPYTQINVADFLSGVAAHQSNKRLIVNLHPRVFSNNFEFFLGGIVVMLSLRANQSFVVDFSELLRDNNFCEDLNRLLLSYVENRDEH